MIPSPPVLAGGSPLAPAFPYLSPAAAAVASLAPADCRWPSGEAGAGFVFCRSPRLPRGSYCALHAAAARSRAPQPAHRA